MERQNEAKSNPRPINVLWVVGNPQNRETLKASLENCVGGKINFTTSPPAALELLENQSLSPPPDLVVIELSDSRLMTGLIENLRSHRDDNLKNIPICCLGSDLPEATREKWEDKGVVFPEINLSQPNSLREACAEIL